MNKRLIHTPRRFMGNECEGMEAGATESIAQQCGQGGVRPQKPL